MWPFNLIWSTPGPVPPEYYAPEDFKDDFKFPKGFFHGYATAAPQIEGGVKADGRGPSIWDPFSHKKGNVSDGSTTDVTTGSYEVIATFLLDPNNLDDKSAAAVRGGHQALGDLQVQRISPVHFLVSDHSEWRSRGPRQREGSRILRQGNQRVTRERYHTIRGN